MRSFLILTLCAAAWGASANQTPAQQAAAYIQKMRETADFAYLDRASGIVEQMLKADPKNYDGMRLKAEIETHRHNFPAAAELARKLLERNPSDSGALGMLGDSLMELGQYDAAGETYQEMLSLGANLESYNRMAYHRFVTGKADEALSWMLTAVRAGGRTPENLAWCLVEFGDMLFKTGHTEDARAAYAQALETFPGYHRALAARGRLAASEGKFDEAIRDLKKAQAAIPLPEYAAALEAVYVKLGRDAEAGQQRKLLDAIDRLGQANGEKGNRALALAFADEGRNFDRAVALANGDIENGRRDVYAYDALSWALFRAGRLAEAQAASAKSIALGTPEPLFRAHAAAIADAAKSASVLH